MNIRALQPEDIDKLRHIHMCYYKDEFEFPDFLNNFLCAFVVIDENNEQIISCGGVRLIAECVTLTDKNYPIKDRRTALYQVLDASSFIAGKADFNKIHAVTENRNWTRHLMKIGFHSRGNILALNL